MMAQQTVEGIVSGLEAMIGRPDSTPTLGTIDVPTLIVVGDKDAITPRRGGDHVARWDSGRLG